MDTEIKAQLVSLSQLPNNFDLKTFTDLLMYGYSLAFGYPADEFWPLAGGSFGHSREVEMNEQRSSSKGVGNFILDLQEEIQRLLPDSLHFEFSRRDTSGDLAETALAQGQIDSVNSLFASGLITRDEARSMLAEKGIIPNEWTLPDENVTSTDTKGRALRDELLDKERVARARVLYPNAKIMTYQWPKDELVTIYSPEKKTYKVAKRNTSKVVITNELISLALSTPIRRQGGTTDLEQLDNAIDDSLEEVRTLTARYKGGDVSSSKWKEEVITLTTLLYLRSWFMGRGVTLPMAQPSPSGGSSPISGLLPTGASVSPNGAVTLPDGSVVMPTDKVSGSLVELIGSLGGNTSDLPSSLANITLTAAETAIIEQLINNQVTYLDNFVNELSALSALDINNRAGLYLNSSRQAFERAQVFGMANLPAYPCDGSTPCLSNCRCHWEVSASDHHLVAYWRLGAADHCIACTQRADEWNPYIVRLTNE